MNQVIVTAPEPQRPDILAETLRVANAMYLALYGVKPYPPQRPE